MKEIVLAVTGLNNTDNPGPGIPFIRGVLDSKKLSAKIIGLAYENLEPGIYMKDLVHKTYQIPYPSSGSDSLLRRLEEIQAKEKIDVLIPNFDAELYTFIKSSDRLKKIGIHTFLPTMEQFEERHKSNLVEFGEKYDVLVPFSKPIYKEDDLYDIKEDFEYPVWIKGQYYEAYSVKDVKEAKPYFHKLAAKWGLPVVIQEYIKGTEVNVVALGDGKGNTVGAVPMKKLYITDKGKGWSGITLDDDKMIELTHKIISGTKWRGGMELELIKTKDGKYYLIEINPRLPAWVYLSVGAGQNLPEALVMLALGEEVKPYSEFKSGTVFIRYSYDLIRDISEFEKLVQRGEL